MAQCQSNELIDTTEGTSCLLTLQFILHKQFLFIIFKLWEKVCRKQQTDKSIEMSITDWNYLTKVRKRQYRHSTVLYAWFHVTTWSRINSILIAVKLLANYTYVHTGVSRGQIVYRFPIITNRQTTKLICSQVISGHRDQNMSYFRWNG